MLEATSVRLGPRNVDVIFTKAQSGSRETEDGDDADGAHEAKIAAEAIVLDFVEFWESCCALAVFEDPDPYVTVGLKIRRFMEKTLLPRLDVYKESGEHGVRNHVSRENHGLGHN